MRQISRLWQYKGSHVKFGGIVARGVFRRINAMKLLAIGLIILSFSSAYGQSSNAEAYPADLFDAMVPRSLIRTNQNGFSLLAPDGKIMDVSRQGRSYFFTNRRTRETIRADRVGSGWELYDKSGRSMGRVHTASGRSSVKSSRGYITSSSTNSAEIYFRHMYREK